jgi:deoxyadenosine/deoxycytidine kinase
MNYNYIVIEGNIGSGKTSLATMMAEKHGARLILEQFEDNPFLPKFYKEPDRYSFPLELSFLATRYHHLNKELTNIDLFKPLVLADYVSTKSLIFASVTLKPDEYTLYRQIFNIIDRNLPRPDLLVYLYLPVDRLIANIRKRGRAYEKDITPEYLENIHLGYMNWLNTQRDMKILMIDRSGLDFVNNIEDFNKIDDCIFGKKMKIGINRLLIS